MATDWADVPPAVVAELRAICLALPEAYEDDPWTGARWGVRKRTFAHVWAVNTPKGPLTMVTLRSEGEELDVLRHAGHPFYVAAWGHNVLWMAIDDTTDWIEVSELVTESFCIMAPKKLVAAVNRPGD